MNIIKLFAFKRLQSYKEYAFLSVSIGHQRRLLTCSEAIDLHWISAFFSHLRIFSVQLLKIKAGVIITAEYTYIRRLNWEQEYRRVKYSLFIDHCRAIHFRPRGWSADHINNILVIWNLTSNDSAKASGYLTSIHISCCSNKRLRRKKNFQSSFEFSHSLIMNLLYIGRF